MTKRQAIKQVKELAKVRFTQNGEGFVYDSETDLEWCVGPDEDTDWNGARTWVDSLNVSNKSWRLPTREELRSLYKKYLGTRNMPTVFKTTGWYVWSGETASTLSAWFFCFDRGDDFYSTFRCHIYGRAFAVRKI